MTEQQMPTISNINEAIEAILFAAGYPVKYDKLAEVLGLSAKDVRLLCEHMAAEYEKAGRGILMLCLPETCQLTTKEQYMPYIREALGIQRGGNLSASSLEVLAIVAYHQPVTRSQIEHIRGVDSSYAVNSLVTKKLIEEKGRLEVPGRPVLFGTTLDFLRCFGLSSLADLPDASVFMENTQTELDLSPAPDEGESFTDSADSEEPKA